MDYLTAPNISLILQALMLVGLTLGYISMKQKKLTRHSHSMFTIYLIHVLSVVIFMLTPAFNIFNTLLSTNLGYITVLHGTFGVIVLTLSMYVISKWRFRKTVSYCYKMKKNMKALIILWVAEVILGAFVYFIIYVQ